MLDQTGGERCVCGCRSAILVSKLTVNWLNRSTTFHSPSKTPSRRCAARYGTSAEPNSRLKHRGREQRGIGCGSGVDFGNQFEQ